MKILKLFLLMLLIPLFLWLGVMQLYSVLSMYDFSETNQQSFLSFIFSSEQMPDFVSSLTGFGLIIVLYLYLFKSFRKTKEEFNPDENVSKPKDFLAK